MKMQTHCSLWRAMVPLVLAILVLCGMGATVLHRKDNFNNNSLASFWQVKKSGNARVRESNSRLEFRSIGPTSPLSAAAVQFEPFGIDWTHDFHIEWKGRFHFPPLTGNRKCFMGTLLVIEGQFPQTMTGLGCGYYKDQTGIYFGILEFSNGAITNVVGTVTLYTTGTKVRIDWNKAGDRITAIQDHLPTGNPGPYVPLFGFFAEYGDKLGDEPMVIVQGVLMIGSNFTITGTQVNIDNWKADFVRRDFP